MTLVVSSEPLQAEEKLPQSVSELIHGVEYREAHWGCLVVDLKSGETLVEVEANKLFAPASTTKLFSVATAFDAIGAETRIETPLVRRGEITSEGHLRGDLILIAQGDLNLGGRTNAQGELEFVSHDHTYANDATNGELTKTDPLAGLKELARQVAASGIKRIQGDILIDDRLFEGSTSSGSGPTQVTSIMVNDNLIDLTFTPAAIGQLAKFELRPPTSVFRIESQVMTVVSDKSLELGMELTGPHNIRLMGQIPEGHKPLLRTVEVPDAASFARSLLIECLKHYGITVERSLYARNSRDKLPASDSVAGLPRVAVLQALPFREAAKLILKSSHNLHASALPLLVAARQGKRELAEGMRLQREFLIRAGVPVETISFGGGAGGHPADAVTPRATVALLKFMASREDAQAFRTCLPILGVDGTLSETVDTNSPARGQIQAKTGTLYYRNLLNNKFLVTSKALAGYMTTSTKRELAFAVFVNRAHISEASETARVGRTLGRFCELVWQEF